jgi:hypothetical protein
MSSTPQAEQVGNLTLKAAVGTLPHGMYGSHRGDESENGTVLCCVVHTYKLASHVPTSMLSM